MTHLRQLANSVDGWSSETWASISGSASNVPLMKVLALVTDAFGGYGGIAQYNRDLISSLAENNEVSSVRVAPRLTPNPVRDLPAKVEQLAPRMRRVQYAMAAARLATLYRPELIFNGHLYHGTLAALLAKISGARLISQLHGTEVWSGVSKAHVAGLRASDLVLCVSNDTRQRTALLDERLKPKLQVVPNMVRDVFVPGDRDAARKRFGLTDERVIVTVSRLDGRQGYKGHDRIIRQLPSLIAELGNSVRYLIAGTGEDRPRLEQIARDLGVADKTRFLGHVPAADLPDLYRAADVFAMPSTGEGFGIVYLEAMACGTPAIGLNVGGVPDAFVGESAEWCVTSEAFPNALLHSLRQSHVRRHELASDVRNRFGHPAFRRRLDDALERVTALNA